MGVLVQLIKRLNQALALTSVGFLMILKRH